MARKTKDLAEATREGLIDAAESVFHEKGVANATLGGIAERAGVTRGAFYWHFKNKSELFLAMLDRVHMPFDELVESAPSDQRAQGPLSELHQGCLQALKRLEQPRYKRIVGIVLHRCEAFSDIDPIEIRAELARHDLESTLPKFKLAKQQGELQKNLDAETANALMHSLLHGLITTWHLDYDAFSLYEEGGKEVGAFFRLIAAHD